MTELQCPPSPGLVGGGAMSWVDVAVSAGALVPIYLGMLIGRWLRWHCPPALFRALVLAALAIGGLQMIRAALSWALASRLWQGRTGAIRLLTGYRLCLSLFQGTR